MNQKRIKAVIEYDGSLYHGFQIQHNAITVQETIQDCIYSLIGEKVSLLCAGRTDSGVHALGQVIVFDTCSSIPPEKWQFALNSALPDDIRVLKSSEAALDFHPRYHAVSKHYRYLLYQKAAGQVFYRRYAYCNNEAYNIEKMKQACEWIKGRHNFESFCASGSSVTSYEREVKTCTITSEGSFIQLDIEANGFLYNMVRIIMGTLLEVGQRKYAPEYVREILSGQDRSLAGPTAPPQGLYMVSVHY